MIITRLEAYIRLATLTTLVALGCAQAVPAIAADKPAAKVESVPDKAVIYIVRQPMDSWEASTVALDDNQQITTYRGTYYRWEVAPGPHQIAGYAGAGGSVKLSTAPGKVYFVRHTVLSGRFAGSVTTQLREINEHDGRKLIAQSQPAK
jgi:hypothetical protein